MDETKAESIKLNGEDLSDFRICEFVSVMNLKGKKVLDVGFGNGAMLFKIRKLGAIVKGIDLDLSAVNSARKYLGLDVAVKTLDELEGDRFDLIMMNDLIEHPPQPFALLKQANSLLNDRGLISIFTPNASFVHLEKDPVIFRVDLEHLQYLTFETLQYIANELKLRKIHLESVGFPDLKGIDRLSVARTRPDLWNLIVKIVSNTPIRGAYVFWNRRYQPNRLLDHQFRLGRYHLFCIFQK